MSYFGAFVFLLLLAGIGILLERNHHRTAALPRAPYGTSPHADSDLWRVLHDLEATPSPARPPSADR